MYTTAPDYKNAKGHSGSKSRQQYGAPNWTGRTPVHQRRSELKQEPVQPQVNVDVWGLVEHSFENDGQVVWRAKHV